MSWLTFTGSVPVGDLRPAFEQAFMGLDGSWTIEIMRELVGGWWLLAFRRDDGFERTLLLSPREQAPTSLRESVRFALRNVPVRLGSRSHGLPPGVSRERRAMERR
jgi:hypothetical protein